MRLRAPEAEYIGNKEGHEIWVLPTKSGLWRVAKITGERYRLWAAAFANWWRLEGHGLAVFPWMWERGGGCELN